VPALERRQSTNRAKEDRMSVATAVSVQLRPINRAKEDRTSVATAASVQLRPINRAKEDRMSVATARGIDRNTSANRAAA
jgi:hypothetical protein